MSFGRRRFHATTLVEAVISLIITSLLMAAALVWVAGVLRASSDTINAAPARTSAVFAADLFAADLGRVVSCDGYGRGPVFAVLASDEVSMFSDVVASDGSAGSDGRPDLIRWEFAGPLPGTVRTVVPALDTDPLCAPSGTARQVRVTDRVGLVSSETVFLRFFAVDGSELSYVADCATAGEFDCRPATVRLKAEVSAADVRSTSAMLDVTVPLVVDPYRIRP